MSRRIVYIDMWQQTFRSMEVSRDEECHACTQRRFDYLSTDETALTTTLCGRNAVQITPSGNTVLDLERLRAELSTLVEVSFNGSVLRLAADRYEMLIFPDGRAMINGTHDEKLARSLYARYVGG
jgi:adenylyltransferase/sulfurtransferase